MFCIILENNKSLDHNDTHTWNVTSETINQRLGVRLITWNQTYWIVCTLHLNLPLCQAKLHCLVNYPTRYFSVGLLFQWHTSVKRKIRNDKPETRGKTNNVKPDLLGCLYTSPQPSTLSSQTALLSQLHNTILGRSTSSNPLLTIIALIQFQIYYAQYSLGQQVITGNNWIPLKPSCANAVLYNVIDFF